MITEEQKLALEAGEFIHLIANLLNDGEIHINDMSEHTAKIILEISEALRRPVASDAYAPLLSKEGFSISQNPRSSWINLVNHLMVKRPSTSVSEVIKQIS